jgi:hypothetical protein
MMSSRRMALRIFSLIAGAGSCALAVHAGPPFLTDDPEPVPYLHYEAYLFSTVDHSDGSSDVQVPAFEFNMGVITNLQLHAIVPLALSAPKDASSNYGMGDIELGAKYRFFEETEYLPEAAVFPLVELPTGSASRGLGNGRAWEKLPLWLQKDWGKWTTYGGGGYALNTAPGQRDYAFGGWLLQREITEQLTLGGEIFSQERAADDGRAYTVFNLGGTWQITPNFSLLFSGGHTITGEQHLIGYFAFYWTWGSD